MARIRFTHLLLCSTAIISTPVRADATLDQLKAKLEQAEKENIILKTQKLERENITMKLEKIESENTALRNEMKVDKTPTASIPAQKIAAVPAKTPSSETKTIDRREPVEISVPTPREHVAARKEINHALENIPKDDSRRAMMAAYMAPKEERPAVVKQWQGVYAGINGGYSHGSQNTTTNGYGTQQAGDNANGIEPAIVYRTGGTSFEGGLAGGQFGYNYQFASNLMIGGELDLDWADISSGGSNYGSSYQAGSTRSNLFSQNGRRGIDWIGTARARLGYAFGNFLPYVTGGLAYGGVSDNSLFVFAFSNKSYTSATNNYTDFFGSGETSNGSSINLGWTAGLGGEYMVAQNWSIKGEYLYTQLNGFNSYGSSINPNQRTGVGNTNYSNNPLIYNLNHASPFQVHQARVGLNYHTGWLGGGAPTVTAKY